MWSFAASVGIFAVLVLVLAMWQRRSRQDARNATQTVDQQISAAAEIAQRRHVQRFGRASTDLQIQALNGTHRIQ